jgi:hypothetical protein
MAPSLVESLSLAQGKAFSKAKKPTHFGKHLASFFYLLYAMDMNWVSFSAF